jgi:hypothetical protein
MNIKVQIEVLKQNIQRKQSGKAQEEIDRGIIDEEEFQFIKDLKLQKKKYKNVSDLLRKKKNYIRDLDQEIRRVNPSLSLFLTLSKCKYLLLTRFDEWYQVRYGKDISD